MNGLETILTNNIGAVVVTGAFLFYLNKWNKENRDERQTILRSFSKTIDAFKKVVSKHMENQSEVTKQSTRTLQDLSSTVTNLANIVSVKNQAPTVNTKEVEGE